MKLWVVCVAYERPIRLRILCDCFITQSRSNWELHVIYDGPVPDNIKNIMALYYDERIQFTYSPERNNQYGHPNRKLMLDTVIPHNSKDYVLMTNDDNYYVPLFVEYMLGECKHNTGMVYCDTVHSHGQYNINKSELRENAIDMGAFIVRCDVAKRTGFNHTNFSADGKYAEECHAMCKKMGLKAIKVNKPLFVHN